MTYTSLGLHPLGYSWNLNLLSPGQKSFLLPYSVMCSSDDQRRVFTIKPCLAGREQCVLVSRTFCLMEQLTDLSEDRLWRLDILGSDPSSASGWLWVSLQVI